MKKTITETMSIPDKVQVKIEHGLFSATGPKGEVQRVFRTPGIALEIKGNQVEIVSKDATRREKKMFYTTRAHINNMLRGVVTPIVYKVKVLSGHFPMNVSVKGEELSVKNFLGEKFPRTLKLTKGVDVKFADNILTVTGCDIEKVSQVAASMEQLTRITNRDRRIFQDGLFIIEKDGVPIE